MTGDARGAAISPGELADRVADRLPGALVGFDVDGVLAPLVDHVDDSVLSDGVADALTHLATRAHVALLSGRSLASLAGLLDFPPGLHVVGSHGLELHGGAQVALTDAEQDAYEVVTSLARRAADECGPGAWLEYKPASVVVHTRRADEPVDDAIDALIAAVTVDPAVTVKVGHDVVELMVRATDKGSALLALAARLHTTSLVFLGDDRTDEDAFARMTPHDISVKVGPGETLATWRLAGPPEVAQFVELLASAGGPVVSTGSTT